MSDGMNPWLSRPSEPAEAAPAAATPVYARPIGPLAPQRGVPAPDQVDQLPTHDQPQPSGLWWLGVHGGAGESTLAGLMPASRAAEHAWPRQPSAIARVLLVARTNMRGLRAAQAAATQWAAGLVPHAEVVGLVLVADAPGRLPRPLRETAQVVSGGVPRTWSVPWVETWRLGELAAPSDAPRDVRRLLDELHVLIGAGATRTAN